MPNLRIAQIRVGHLKNQGGCQEEYEISRSFTLKQKDLNKPLLQLRLEIEKRYNSDPSICLKCSLPLLNLIRII